MTKAYPWTEEQIETLVRLYPNNFACDIADLLGLKPDLVTRKARALGLKKDEGFNPRANYGRYTKKRKEMKV